MFEVSSSDTEDNEIVANIIHDEPGTSVAATVTPTKNLTFLSDNASDIHKALEKLGKYQWLGCAGHHTNLIAQVGFKKCC